MIRSLSTVATRTPSSRGKIARPQKTLRDKEFMREVNKGIKRDRDDCAVDKYCNMVYRGRKAIADESAF